VVWPDVLVAYNRRIGSEVLLRGTPAAILDRGALLDDAGDRGGASRAISIACNLLEFPVFRSRQP